MPSGKKAAFCANGGCGNKKCHNCHPFASCKSHPKCLSKRKTMLDEEKVYMRRHVTNDRVLELVKCDEVIWISIRFGGSFPFAILRQTEDHLFPSGKSKNNRNWATVFKRTMELPTPTNEQFEFSEFDLTDDTVMKRIEKLNDIHAVSYKKRGEELSEMPISKKRKAAEKIPSSDYKCTDMELNFVGKLYLFVYNKKSGLITEQSSVYQITCKSDIQIKPYSMFTINTGTTIDIPEGYCGLVTTSRAIQLKGINVFTTVYTGTKDVILSGFNSSEFEYNLTDKIHFADMVIINTRKLSLFQTTMIIEA